MWTDDLTVQEAEYTKRAMDELQAVDWAKPLLSRVAAGGGLNSANMPLLFEVRYAYDLHLAGARADYEHATGVGDSCVDFRIHGDREWLVELVSLRETQALRRGIRSEWLSKDLLVSESVLKTGGADQQSEEDDMITAMGKIGEKAFLNGKPSKFPVPTSAVHMILVDTRGYLGTGGDWIDYWQIANGARALPPDEAWATHYWNNRPILGLFERVPEHPLRAAGVLQERVHFIGFIAEKEYRVGEIRDRACYRPNPHLLTTNDQLREVSRT